MRNFEYKLPEGYSESMTIDASNKKFGLLLNIIAFVIMVVVLAILIFAFSISRINFNDILNNFIAYDVSLVLMIVGYMICHELVHGICYKYLTKQKLSFGLKLTCAYCGVPNIYVYRRTALISLLAPFTVFSILFGILLIITGVNGSMWYFVFALVFACHLGGCVGDLYDTYLYLTKFQSPSVLMRDTGPKQIFYVRNIFRNM